MLLNLAYNLVPWTVVLTNPNPWRATTPTVERLPNRVTAPSTFPPSTGPQSAQPLPRLILGPLRDPTCLVKCLRGFVRVTTNSDKAIKTPVYLWGIMLLRRWYGLPGVCPQAQIPDPVSSRLLSLGWMRNWHLCGLEDRGRPP